MDDALKPSSALLSGGPRKVVPDGFPLTDTPRLTEARWGHDNTHEQRIYII